MLFSKIPAILFKVFHIGASFPIVTSQNINFQRNSQTTRATRSDKIYSQSK